MAPRAGRGSARILPSGRGRPRLAIGSGPAHAFGLDACAMTVYLSLFGTPAVSHRGQGFALNFERRAQLLVYLAFKRGWVPRSELAALLWPEQPAKLAYTNLRKAIFRLQAFPWADRLQQQGGALRFDSDSDVAAFEVALSEKRIAEAVAMRRGHLLEGFDGGDSEAWSRWLGFERDRLNAAWRNAAQQLLDTGDVDPAQAIDLASRLLEADPLDEAALRNTMTWLARAGQTARARQVYREFVERLADELGLAPSTELQALHGSLGTASTRSVTASLPPVAVDHDFVGRAVELQRIAALLAQDDCRLLTVTGPGGVGKTRLARRVLDELAGTFADGAVFVPLEDIVAPAELGGRLARELGVALAGRTEPLEQVIEFLRERYTLLVLDNFEQLAKDASTLAPLLSACKRVKLVVTSRVRLGLAGEWLLPLEGLPFPEDEDEDRAESFDAVRCFVRAARRVSPALHPAAEAAAIVDICRQVEGLPLALELAAAWTRLLSCAEIAAELRQGTQLLHATDDAHPARHASIDVVFDQSWRLLSEVERETLARLSVFHGSFTAEAARAAAGAPLPVLGALIDKSLLHKEAERLHLHPLVRQLAELRMGDGEAFAQTRALHADYFQRLMAQWKHGAETGDRAVLQQLDKEFENCRRAWHWSMAHGGADALVHSGQTLLNYFDYRGRFEEGLKWFREALDAPVAQGDAGLRALLLSKASHLELRLDHYDEAEAQALESLKSSRRSFDRATRIQALNVLGAVALRRGRLAQAKRFFEERLELVLPDDQKFALAATLDHLALIEKHLGHYAEALRLSMQSLVQHRALADHAGEALCLNNLAALQLAMNDSAAAAVSLAEGLAICERDGLLATEGYIRANLIEVALNAGDLAAAQVHAERALKIALTTANRAIAAWTKIQIARLALKRGEIDAARSSLSDALSTAIALGLPSLKFDALACFSEILSAQGAMPDARRVLDYAASHPTATASARDEMRRRLATLSTDSTDPPAWPDIELDELLNRIVVESPQAYAPLIASLRGRL
jgi:predicted ATPase/DNA-binding SARP family transcriptional activator/tetratricopeptide (TPR) repeat protein